MTDGIIEVVEVRLRGLVGAEHVALVLFHRGADGLRLDRLAGAASDTQAAHLTSAFQKDFLQIWKVVAD